MNRLKIAFGSFLIGGMLAASVASAASVTATLLNIPQGVAPGSDTMQVSFGSEVYNPGWVGQINWVNAGTAANLNVGLNTQLQSVLGANNSFATYCIEGTQNVSFGTTETWGNGVVTLASAPDPGNPSTFNSTQIADLTSFWNRFFDVVGAATGATANIDATAFQLGIWEIANDDTTGLANDTTLFGGGTFQASANVAADTTAINLAKNWLGQVQAGGSFATQGEYSLFALTDGSIQDQLFGVPSNGGGNPPGVPLPEALPTGLALLSGLGLVRFARRRAVR